MTNDYGEAGVPALGGLSMPRAWRMSPAGWAITSSGDRFRPSTTGAYRPSSGFRRVHQAVPTGGQSAYNLQLGIDNHLRGEAMKAPRHAKELRRPCP